MKTQRRQNALRQRIIAVILTLLFGPVGLILGLLAIRLSAQTLSAVWTGVVVVSDLRENTGGSTIFRTTDPGVFWGFVEAYAIIAIVLVLIAGAVIWPLVVGIKAAFLRPAAGNGPSENASLSARSEGEI